MKAISNGLIMTIPLTIVGGISLVLASPPYDPKLMHATNFFMKFMDGWYNWAVRNNSQIMVPYNMTMGIMAVFVAFSIAFFMAKEYQSKYPDLDPLSSAIISTVAFFTIAGVLDKSGGIDMTYLGVKGFFTAMLVGIASVEINRVLLKHNIRIVMPDGVPPAVSATFSALIPMIVNVFLFHLINMGVVSAFGSTLPQAIMNGLTPVLKGTDSIWFVIPVMLVCHLCWLVGIHGGSITGSLTTLVYTSNLVANANAHAAGKPLPYVMTGPLSVYIVVMGGAGATLGLALMMLFSKAKQLKTIGRIGILPCLFGINEPIIFGTPLILNPLLAIPFVITPIVNTLLGFYATAFGLVDRAFINVPWTCPPFIGLPLATMDMRAIILVFVVLAVDIVIYYPFFKAYEKQLLLEEEDNIEVA